MARPKKYRKYSEIEIEQLIKLSDKALYNSIKILYDCQGAQEQAREASIYNNRRGFAKPDAKMLTQMAKGVIDNGALDFDQKAALRGKLVKRYIRQITKLVNERWDRTQTSLI